MPFLTDRYNLNFYGGEPLLCSDLIKETVSFLDEKNSEYDKKSIYSITTNGSLITGETLRFLEEHKFSVIFSFDGYAQDIQRKNGSFERAVTSIKNILERPNLQLEVNSVFAPETVGHLSNSMAFTMDLGVKRINLSPSLLKPWDQQSLSRLKKEMAKLREALLLHYRKSQEVPIISFQEEVSEGFFYCAGGQDRMAVTPEEHVWGCDLFSDFFKGKEKQPEYQDYFFGDLDTFAKNHKTIYPKISTNYRKLSMDNFATPHMNCLFCSNLENCTVCPISATLAGSPVGEIPPFVCAIQKIRIEEQKKFWEEILG